MSILAALIGCGDDGDKKKESNTGTTANSSSASARCERVCERSAAAKCKGDDETECLTECKEAIASTPKACASTLEAVETCAAKAKYQCDDDDEATPIGCDKQIDAWAACLQKEVGTAGDPSAPTPGQDDDDDGQSCTICLAQECTAELTELNECGTSCETAFTCIDECQGNKTCESGCVAMSPSARTIFQDIQQCLADNCSSTCGDLGSIGLGS